MGKERDHYSNKGGHLARSEANRRRKTLEDRYPDVPYMRPEAHIARRSMLRDPQNGKRNSTG